MADVTGQKRIYLSQKEAEDRLEKYYAILNNNYEFPEITLEEYKKLKVQALNGDKKAAQVLKLVGLKAASKQVIYLFLHFETPFEFEDAMQYAYLHIDKYFNKIILEKNLALFKMMVQRRTSSYLNSIIISLSKQNSDLGNRIQENPCKELNPDDCEEEKEISDAELALLRKELSETTQDALENLKPREIAVLRKTFGFDDGVVKTAYEIGKDYHLTHSAISEYIGRGLRRLRIDESLDDYKDLDF